VISSTGAARADLVGLPPGATRSRLQGRRTTKEASVASVQVTQHSLSRSRRRGLTVTAAHEQPASGRRSHQLVVHTPDEASDRVA
jgi:hypothetical protein